MENNSGEPVQVFVRLRPEFPSEDSNNNNKLSRCCALVDDRTIKISPPGDGIPGMTRKVVTALDDKIYSFDRVFPEDCNQEDIYKHVSTHVKATVRGYNTTIFAYGSTGSGKSYTMTGNHNAPGVIPRAISEIFSIIETTAAQEQDVFFYVRISYVELYNNNFRNLLENASKELAMKEKHNGVSNDSLSKDSIIEHTNNIAVNNQPSYARQTRTINPSDVHATKSDKIEVRESQSAGVFLAGNHLRIPVTTAQEAFQLIAKGNKLRAVGSTQCNDVSSRSHAILTIHVESRIASTTPLAGGTSAENDLTSSWEKDDSSVNSLSNKPELRLGKMHLVDLAGSERLTMSGAEGDTLVETQNINLSLTAIGDVLSALSRNATIIGHQHKMNNNVFGKEGYQQLSLVPVPYRNSKLTHLLKDSLGGNSKTIMITNIRTISEYYQQTSVSLMYASRAKKVRNRSLVNRNVIGDTGIHAVTSEIERLKLRLDERSSEFERLKLLQMKEANENVTLKSRLLELNKANESEKKQLEVQMSSIITSQAGQLQQQKVKISSLQKALQDELSISQNRIAEQEKEIKWLKKALSDTAQQAQQPVEQIERMQKVVDAWQSQANNATKELDVVLNELNSFKALNQTLHEEIQTLKTKETLLYSEISDKNKLLEQGLVAADEQVSALNALKIEKNGLLKCTDDLKMKLIENMEASKSREEMLFECKQQISRLQQQVEENNSRPEYDAVVQANACLTQENTELQHRLNNIVKDLEQRTALAIEGASNRLQAIDKKRIEAESAVVELTNKLQENEAKYNATIETMAREHKEQEQHRAQAVTDEIQQGMEELEKKYLKTIEDMEVSHRQQLDEAHASVVREQQEVLMQHIASFEQLLAQKQAHYMQVMSEKDMEVSAKQHEIEKASEIIASFVSKEEELRLAVASVEEKYVLLLGKKDEQLRLLGLEMSTLQNDSYSSATNKEKEYIDALSNLKSQHVDEIESTAKKYQDELRVVTAELNLAREKYNHNEMLTQSLRDELQALEAKSSEEKESLLASHAQVVAEEKRELLENISQLTTSLDHVTQEKNAAIAQLVRDQDAKVDELTKSMEVLKAKIASKNNEIETLRSSHKEELSHVLTLQQQTLLDKHRDESDKLRKLNHEIELRHQEELNAVRETYASDINTIRSSLESVHKKSIDALNEEMISIQDRYTIVSSNNESMKQEYNKIISDLKGEHAQLVVLKEKAISNLSTAYEQQVTLLKQEHAHELGALQQAIDKLTRSNAQLEASYKQDIEELKATMQSDHEREVESMKKANQVIVDKITAEHARMNEKHIQEIESLANAHKQAMHSLQQQVDGEHVAAMEAVMQRMETDHAVVVAKLSSEHEEALAQVGREHAAAMEALSARFETEHASDLAKLSSEHKEALVQVEHDHKVAMESLTARLETEHAAVIAKLSSEHKEVLVKVDDEYKVAVETLMKRRDSEHAAVIAKLSSEHKEALAQVEREHVSAMEALEQRIESEYASKLAQLSSEHKEALAQVEREHIAAIETQAARTESEHASELAQLRSEHEEALTQVACEHKLSLEALTARMETEHASALAKLSSEHEVALLHVESEHVVVIESLTKRLETEHASALAELRSEHIDAMAQIEGEHKQVMSDLVKDFETKLTSEVTSLSTNHEAIVTEVSSKLSAQHELVVANLALEHQSHCDALIAEHSKKIEEMEQLSQLSKSEVMQQLQDNHKEELEALRVEHMSVVEGMQQQFSAEKAKLIEEMSALHQLEMTEAVSKKQVEIDALAVELSEARDEIVENITTQHASLETLTARMNEKHIQEIESLANAHKQAMHSLQQQVDGEHVAAMEAVMQRMETDHTVVVAKLSSEHEEALAQVGREHAAAMEALTKRCETEHASDLAKLSSEHKEALVQVEHDHKVAMESLTARLETEHAAVIAKLSSEHKEALAQVEHEHKVAMEALAKRIESEYASKLAQLSSEYEEATKEAVNKAREAVSHHHTAEFDSFRADEEKKVQAICHNYEDIITSIKAEKAHAQERCDDLKKIYGELLGSHKEIVESTTVNLKLAKEEYTKEIAAITSKHQQEIEYYQYQLKHLNEVHSKEIAGKDTELQLQLLCTVQNEKEKFTSELDAIQRSLIVEKETILHEKNQLEKELQRLRGEKEAPNESVELQQMRRECEQAKQVISKLQEEVAQLHQTRLTQQLSTDKLQELSVMMKSLVPVATAPTATSAIPDVLKQFIELLSSHPQIMTSLSNIPAVPPVAPLPQASTATHSKSHEMMSETEAGLRESTSSFKASLGTSMHRTPSIGTGNNTAISSSAWSSPVLISSPTDQLIAAILDGDVQGIRSVVRSKCDDLNGNFWRDLTSSILPLHRAISGLHFHGSEKLLVATIDALTQLGADVNAIDHAGNTALHKAIHICTSKSVHVIVTTLLTKGARVNVFNREGDTPLHSECRRVRSASVEVIESLIQAGANVNTLTSSLSSSIGIFDDTNAGIAVAPLTLVLQRGAATGSLYDLGLNNNNNEEVDGHPATASNDVRVTGKKIWVKAAETLLKAGAKWDPLWRGHHKSNQLYLILHAFPPAKEDIRSYRSLVHSAINDGGFNPCIEDEKGRNCFFVVCERMATVSTEQYPDPSSLVQILIDGYRKYRASHASDPSIGIGGSDRVGRTLFDLREKCSFSCLNIVKPLLVEATMASAGASNSRVLKHSTSSNIAMSESRVVNGKATKAAASKSSRNNSENNENYDYRSRLGY